MTIPKKVVAYAAEDGKLFGTEQEAILHDVQETNKRIIKERLEEVTRAIYSKDWLERFIENFVHLRTSRLSLADPESYRIAWNELSEYLIEHRISLVKALSVKEIGENDLGTIVRGGLDKGAGNYGDLDQGSPNHTDHNRRFFRP